MADPGICVDCITETPEGPQAVAASPEPHLVKQHDPLDPTTIIIEFCDRILPLNSEETGGRFRVWLFLEGQPPNLVWDRKIEGGFPELKALKQRVRDRIQPGKSLGHSDKHAEQKS
ncbi:uncharacterized protein B0H18DRAFT_967075 [Fomitopsis serialis]|uniref:uncharacterized protein n=1 Tax=Fomitopsis serialis TaxID=139415 RepID=UPI00200745FD|nr:uncharacterized protein B0H18DRAFT_967075 [Neoantrodia serialis]KAH9938419.1 hypothetical protein B0H18DRAFT_967075 [Neoantrodia serialis]